MLVLFFRGKEIRRQTELFTLAIPARTKLIPYGYRRLNNGVSVDRVEYLLRFGGSLKVANASTVVMVLEPHARLYEASGLKRHRMLLILDTFL